MKDHERKLATVRRIREISPIIAADSLECARVGGWAVVIRKGQFKAGDMAIYLEIDSWVPHELAPFLSKGGEPRIYKGIAGRRLRTLKLRGQLSQGLLLPLPAQSGFILGDDVTDLLGVKLYELPIPAVLQGSAKGEFPAFIPRTKQERVQNLEVGLFQGRTFEVTEKLNGTSMTVYVDGVMGFGVASRNLDLCRNDVSSYWVAAHKARLFDILETCSITSANYALQGELVGEGIQGNPYKLRGCEFRLFDVFDIGKGKYLTPKERRGFASIHGIDHVPVLSKEYSPRVGSGYGDVIAMAIGDSDFSPCAPREGAVFRCVDEPDLHFKVLSNAVLLADEDG